MNAIDKTISTDISLAHLLDVLAVAPDAPLVFSYDGNTVRAGYHVTEVKAGIFSALDCGANPEAWAEIFVQLWDIDEDDRTHMPAGKFAAIIRKVSDHVQLEPTAKLTFEISDGERPMALYCASAPRLVAGTFEVSLVARPASCKPRDRWLAEEQAKSSCCGPASTTSKCCA
ncbi:hypothetical protein DSM25558_2848 [Agrobacterium sp. DSM 25558]|uniref:DUF6428 family protein n=1 Tax=Rhizobium/Agrobacterium group TaxID=227290 RepID=UPI0007978810|nr:MULTISPECIES: DUF6428 family protein [Rhizobium/Agrobacterium group]CZT37713.1 hypothetical protein GA0004734_00046160 [Rhizobium sp. 9140]SCX21088.1 hypothetical protein DSM25558_2848 [Agrobacterium sp. DSM 25558]HAU77722.1 hypothetical protein [Agrobacterium sp.]